MNKKEYLDLIYDWNHEKSKFMYGHGYCDGCGKKTYYTAEVLIYGSGEADCCYECYMLLHNCRKIKGKIENIHECKQTKRNKNE